MEVYYVSCRGTPSINHLHRRNRRGAQCAPALWLNVCLAVPCTGSGRAAAVPCAGSGRAAGEQCSPLRLHICRRQKKSTAEKSAVLWHDWCVSRVLSWTVIYLECTLPCISSRQSGRSGQSWSQSALLRIEFTDLPCCHGTW